MATLQVKPISPTIGALISGANLQQTTAADIAQIRAALVEHQVVFFEDQAVLTPEQQIQFGRAFGDLHIHPAAPTDSATPELFVIHADEKSKVANGNGWHTDVSCDECPPMATILQLHKLPSAGGDTLFTSTCAAYEALSPAMQNFLCSLTAKHESEHIYRGRYTERGVADEPKDYPNSIHPVVRTHPESGRRSLYVNPSFTTKIVELAADESQALLQYLYRHQQRPEFQVRYRWQPNAIAFWDNRSTQHFAMWDYWPEVRTGHRVTVLGDRPYFDADATTPSSTKPGLAKLSRQRL